jgi:peptidoglycan/LPS O-acetylase OafA/YrhL
MDRSSGRGESFYIPSLDGIRALAFLLVFLSHIGLGDRIPGGFGVTAFFFLSGYLIVTLLRAEADRDGSFSLKMFYARRVLRIFPPCYLVLVIAVILNALGIVPGGRSLAGLAAEFFYVTNYYTLAGGNAIPKGTGVLWSLAVEEHFYLFFPIVYIILRRLYPRPAHQAVILGWFCAAMLLWRCVLIIHFHAPSTRTFLATDTRFDSILFGCILAIYGNPAVDRTRVQEHVWKWILLPIAIGVLVLTFTDRSDVFRDTLRYTLQGIALFPVFITAVRYPRWLVFRILNLRIVRFVGVLSYTLYLVHYIVIETIDRWRLGSPLVQGILSLTISLLVAVAIYYLVERPCARLRRYLRSRPTPQAGDVLARPRP